ncbi:MAG TPA: BTAD domain-containing putative transcriptional regulator [Actinocatenispora sp.]
MEFSLLGPVEARLDGRVVPLGPPKQRLLLAVLLLEPGRLIPVDRLYDLLWGEAQPRNARTAVQVLVSRLRAALAAADADAHGVRLVTREPGYLIEVAADRVDLHRFRALVDRAGRSDSTGHRARLLADALALWRGPALADVTDPRVRDRLCAGLTEQYWRALEDSYDAELSLGRHAELLPGLRDRVADQPLRQRLVGQLMLALYRNGQQDDALAVYHRLRDALADELGLDPVPELRTLHEAVLRADHDPVRSGWEPPSPAQLPPVPAGFAGRGAELARLDRLVDTPGPVVVSGVAGVGKTALAVRWAHARSNRYPDGTLHADLRGYRTDGEPVHPGAVLDRFLRALGVPGPRVPADPQSRTDLYRSMMADRRILVVLDNAATAAQVRPLLPAAPGCTVLVTSRDRLGGLVATEGARLLSVAPLDDETAGALLADALGPGHDPAVAAELARLCDRLPLALRIAAGRLAVDPACSPESLAADLASAEDRLDALRLDADASVAEAFAGSYRALSAPAARLFRLLCLAPGAEVGAYAAAALAGVPVARARTLLSELTVANLVLPLAGTRYGMHDLIRAYARQRLDADEPAAGRDAALRRLAVGYLRTLAAAREAIGGPQRFDPCEQIADEQGETPAFASRGAALDWLDTEREPLAEMVELTAAYGWPEICWRLVHLQFRYQELRGRYDAWVALERAGLAAAEACGDEFGIAARHRALGTALGNVAPGDEAFAHLAEALRRHRAAGDAHGELSDETNLGLTYFHAGRYQAARDHTRTALRLARAAGDVTHQVLALNNLGISQGADGQVTEAARTLREGIALSERTGRTDTLHLLYANLAEALTLLGDPKARHAAIRGRQLSRIAGDRAGEAAALLTLAEWLPPDEARAALQDALRLYREVGSRSAERVRDRLRDCA